MKWHEYRQRRACRLVGLSRSVGRYRGQPRWYEALRARLKELAVRYPRYGYLRLHVLLAGEDLVVNAKRTYGVYREKGLQVRRRKRRRLPRRDRVVLAAPERPMQRWLLNQQASGRRFRVLNIVDDCSRGFPGQIVDLSISGERLARFLDDLAGHRGLPETLVLDNDPELTSRPMFEWSRRTGVNLHFIEPGQPIQNAFVDSFNGRFATYV